MKSQCTLRLDVTIRRCERRDLEPLEWFGMFYEHREIIRDAHRRHVEGSAVMLVADTGAFPVGQLWIDLGGRTPELWALRVLPPLQGRGLGSALMAAGERLLAERGAQAVQVGCDRHNVRARRFYERRGYRRDGERIDRYSYRHPAGYEVAVRADLWILTKAL